MNLNALNDLIRTRSGLSFEGENEGPLRTAVESRMAATGEGGAERYHARLLADGDEFHELLSLLTINETYFYREPEQLTLLTERLLPRLLAARDGSRPIRIFSAGCSSGEEPYSIAIALRERYGESASRLFTVSGGDIDRKVLARARNGRYTPFSFRALADELKQRHFTPCTGGDPRWEVRREVREMVTLHPFNLLADPAEDEAGGVDVIFFRNVSIYFDAPTRRTILARLKRLLAEDGVLVVSSAETLANDFGLLSLVEDGGHFYFANRATVERGREPVPRATPRRAAATAPTPRASLHHRRAAPATAPATVRATAPATTPATPGRAAARPPATPPAAAAAAEELARATALVAEKRHDLALPIIERLISSASPGPAPHLLMAHILANRAEFAGAEREARRALELSPWSDEAPLLLGMIAKRRGLAEEATRWFRQAVYSRPDCWPAHYHLAELYRGGGDGGKAGREYRVVLTQLASAAPHRGVVPIDYPVAEVRLLCERHLADLNAAAAPTPR